MSLLLTESLRIRAQGCYKGFSSMILKEGLGNTVYFGSYELCKQVRVDKKDQEWSTFIL